MLYRYILTLMLLFDCLPARAYAEQMAVQFSGFASLTLSYSDDPDIGFSTNYLDKSDTGWSLTRDSILGGQANITLAKEWDSVVQLVFQDHAYTGIDNFLELAFLRYRPNRNWAIRAGRMNSDLYLLSEYPNVGFAYLWIRPPHDYYAFTSAGGRYDGADIEYSQVVGEGFLRLKLGTGQSTSKFQSADEDFFVSIDNLMSLSANYSVNQWRLRLSVSRADIDSYRLDPLTELIGALKSVPVFFWPLAMSVAQSLDTQGHEINYAAFGLSYDSENWLIQSEVGVVESAWIVTPSNLNAYTSAGYRFAEFTLYSGFSFSKNRHDASTIVEPQFPAGTPDQIAGPILQLAAVTQNAIDRPIVNQHSFNIGLNWQFSEDMVVKAQVDHFNIQALGGGLWDIDDPIDVHQKHKINVFSLGMSTVF